MSGKYVIIKTCYKSECFGAKPFPLNFSKNSVMQVQVYWPHALHIYSFIEFRCRWYSNTVNEDDNVVCTCKLCVKMSFEVC